MRPPSVRTPEARERGFTLIELLVVIIIIGVLASIAVPVFLNQRKKGVDAALKSDLRQAAMVFEDFYAANGRYPGADTPACIDTAAAGPYCTVGGYVGGPANFNFSAGSGTDDIRFKLYAPGNRFCIHAWGSGATKNSPSNRWVWLSDQGGLQPASVTLCP